MLKERSQSLKLIFIFMDLLIAGASFGIAFLIRYYIQDKSGFYINIIDIRSYVYLGIALSLSQIAAFNSVDLYHPRRGLSFADELIGILYGVFLNIIVVLSLLFFFRGESFSRLVILYYTIAVIVLMVLSHSILRGILKSLRKKGYNLRKMIIIGTGKTANSFADLVKKHTLYGYIVKGFISVKPSRKKSDHQILGTLKDFEKIVTKERVDLAVYTLSSHEGDSLKEIIDICDYENIDLKIIPSYSEFITMKGRVEDLDGMPLISIRNIPIRLGYNKFIKRIFDLVFSLIFVTVFSPIYLAIALAIRFTSEGPIVLKQERVGLDNKKFNIYKFRTMYVQEKTASDTLWTKKNDPRVTSVGSILRKLSLDEIPQFFNVIKGNMSVVGPRPERPYFVEKFRGDHRQYMRRHAVKAGITGWAQVNGLRGDTSIEKRVEADIFYIENWSLIFDLKIILLTPFKGVLNRNAY